VGIIIIKRLGMQPETRRAAPGKEKEMFELGQEIFLGAGAFWCNTLTVTDVRPKAVLLEGFDVENPQKKVKAWFPKSGLRYTMTDPDNVDSYVVRDWMLNKGLSRAQAQSVGRSY
jgi:hypothetical protein